MSVVVANAIRVETIPKDLRARRSWVTWRSIEEGGRTVKPPFNPCDGRMASCSNPATWASFDEALAALAEGSYDGLGFQLTPPFVGVDLDGCREPETGFIDDGAQAIIEQLDSYTEVSPSGRGIHILVTGELPPGRNRTKGVEMYDRVRYFTVTGRHVAGTPLTVEARSAELAALHRQTFGSQKPRAAPHTVEPQEASTTHASASLADDALVARMKAAGNGELFERLWRGEWVGDYPSQSEADGALCCILAFWTGRDAERMDQLFRQSGLYRPKWDEPRGVRTYGDLSIAMARWKTYGTWNPGPDRAMEGVTT